MNSNLQPLYKISMYKLRQNSVMLAAFTFKVIENLRQDIAFHRNLIQCGET